MENRNRPMTSAERKRKSREKLKAKMTEEDLAEFKDKERKRIAKAVQAGREKKRRYMTTEQLAEYKQSESNRVSTLQKRKRDVLNETNETAAAMLKLATPKTKTQQPYKTRQSYSKAISAARLKLPASPRRRKAVVAGLASAEGLKVETQYVMNIQRNASEEIKESVREFYYRTDISYTAPGMVDEMVIYDTMGKRRLRKYYLTMHLREAYAIYKETLTPELQCCRSLFCALRPKNVLLLGDSPSDQCKCQVHENLFMKLEAMGINYDKSFWSSMLCDTSPNSECWLNQCEECKDGKKFVPLKNLDTITVYKQWGDVVVANQSKQKGEGGSDSYTKLGILIKEVMVSQVLDEFQEQFKNTAKHCNVKRIQAGEFQNDLKEVTIRVLQIDYAMAYQCENQQEVMGALWARGSVNLFTCAMYHKGSTSTMLYCTDYKGKDKWANGFFIEDLYENFPTTDEIKMEVIWSDGPVAEFKNQYMRQLLENLSIKYNKPFIWKFSATSHGKGVVDGVGGKVKSSVRRNVMSLRKDRYIVQNAADFVKVACKVSAKTTIKYIPVSQIEEYKTLNPLKLSKAVPGISMMHVIAVDGANSKLWRNSAYQNSGAAAHISLRSSNENTLQSFAKQSTPVEPSTSVEAPPLLQSLTHANVESLSYHDVVEVINGPFIGYYATVTEKNLRALDKDDEIEINYLKQCDGNKLMMVPHDLDSRPLTDLKKISAQVDGKARYFVAFLEE